MAEYGTLVGEASSVVGAGSSGGSFDAARSFQDVIDQIAAQPPEILLVAAALVIAGGLFVFRRV